MSKAKLIQAAILNALIITMMVAFNYPWVGYTAWDLWSPWEAFIMAIFHLLMFFVAIWAWIVAFRKEEEGEDE